MRIAGPRSDTRAALPAGGVYPGSSRREHFYRGPIGPHQETNLTREGDEKWGEGIVGDVRYPVARKDHPCDWCVEDITAGTKHAAWTWSDGKKLFTIRAHYECSVVWAEDPDQFGERDCQRGLSRMDSEDWQWNNPTCEICGKRFAIDEDECREICSTCQALEAEGNGRPDGGPASPDGNGNGDEE